MTCSAYPLEYLDTIHSETGDLQTKSALNLIGTSELGKVSLKTHFYTTSIFQEQCGDMVAPELKRLALHIFYDIFYVQKWAQVSINAMDSEPESLKK